MLNSNRLTLSTIPSIEERKETKKKKKTIERNKIKLKIKIICYRNEERQFNNKTNNKKIYSMTIKNQCEEPKVENNEYRQISNCKCMSIEH